MLTKIPTIIKSFPHLQLFPTLSLPLTHFSLFSFTLLAKKKQLILHTPNQLQKMHVKKKTTNNPWIKIQHEEARQFRISLIGLPNSGKSTIFNCIIGEHLALVDNKAGTTRDRREYEIMNGLVKVIDTPGIQVSELGKKINNGLKNDIFKQTITAIHESHLIIVVVDAQKPIGTDEMDMIKYLRKIDKNKHIILCCNKTEKIFDQSLFLNQMSILSIPKIFLTSGINGSGIYQILQYINTIIPQQIKSMLQQLKATRTQKFEKLVQKLKKQLKQLQQKGVNVKQWQQDFRKINRHPQLNPDLDYQQFQQHLLKPQETFTSTRGTSTKNLQMKKTIKICFIGRPNVGKSSLINQILGQQRMSVSEQPHTTSDSIPTKILYKNRKIEVIDTAGLDHHQIQRIEKADIRKALHSTVLHVKQSHVIVYVMDAFAAFKIEDFQLIRIAIEEGRPVLIAVNKWQAIKQQYKYKAKNYLWKQIDENLGHMVHGHPIVFVSAKMNEGIDTMLDSVIFTYDKWNTRISTGMLNDWLQKFKKLDNLPKDDEMTLRINYVIQALVRPPHFIFFVNNRKLFKDNYLRFVTDNLAKEFKMDGIPFKITFRSTSRKQNSSNMKRKPSYQKVSPMKAKMEQLKKKYDNFGL